MERSAIQQAYLEELARMYANLVSAVVEDRGTDAQHAAAFRKGVEAARVARDIALAVLGETITSG